MFKGEYIDIKGMQERADKEFLEKVEKSKEVSRKQQEEAKKEREYISGLFASAIIEDREKTKSEKAKEIEEAKAKALAEVDAEYENKGVKSEDTKRKDAAYRKMIENIPGLND